MICTAQQTLFGWSGMKEHEMDGARSTYDGVEKCIQDICGEI